MRLPAEPVWALVSGLPRGKRERRIIMTLQAYIDDSAHMVDEGDPVFVLGGFVANVTQWCAFCDDWRRALDEAPAIEYFKMYEAETLRGQFARELGWTEESRDKKLNVLADIIKSYVQERISCSINKNDFATYLRSMRVPERTSIIDKPYCIAFQTVVMSAVSTHLYREMNEPCDFIFDDQGSIGNDALATWDNIKAAIERMAAAGRSDYRPYLGSKPIFRDDKTFLPLQAADMYAWQIRRNFYENKLLYMAPRPVLKSLQSISSIERHMGASELSEFRDGLEQARKVVFPKVKEAELKGYAGTQRQQRATRVAARKSRSKS